MDQSSVSAPVTKITLAWAGVAVSFTFSWGEVAAMLASLYTTLMIVEWVWKHGVRDFFVKRGWVKPAPRAAE